MSLFIRNGKVGIRGGYSPELHELMKPTFKVKNQATFGKCHGVNEWNSRKMIMRPSIVFGMIGVHSKRTMKHHF